MIHLIALAALALPHLDQHGDPLPPGAVARFGTIRFRVGAEKVRYSHALSPDGKYLAVEDPTGINLWDTDTGRVAKHLPWRTWQGNAPKFGLCFSPDGKRLARLAGRVVAVWDLATGTELFDVDCKSEGELQAIGFVPGNDELIVTADQKPWAWTLDARTGRVIRATEFEGNHWALTPAGSFLLDLAGSYWTLSDPATGKERAHFRCAGSNRESLTLSPDQKRVWIADTDGNLQQFAVATGERNTVVGPPPGWQSDGGPVASAVSPDGTVVYMANGDCGIYRRDLRAGRWLTPIPDVPRGRLLPHPEGKRLFVLGADGVLRRYDLATVKELPGPSGFGGSIVACPSPDGRHLAAVSDGPKSRLELWDSAARRVWTTPLEGRGAAPSWTPDSGWVGVPELKTFRLFDSKTGQTVRSLPVPEEFLTFGFRAHFPPGGDRLVVPVHAKDGVAVFNPWTGERLAVWRTDTQFAKAISPDGQLVFYHDHTQGCRLFDVSAGRFTSDWVDPLGEDRLVIAEVLPGFTPDGSYLITWEPGPPQEGRRPEGVVAVLRDPRSARRQKAVMIGLEDKLEWACSPDGLWLAVGDQHGRLHLFDLTTGARLGWWLGHRDRITSVHFVGSGRVVTASADLTALVWDVRPRPRLQNQLWESLSGADGWPAWLAVWTLASDPKAPELLRSKITPVAAPPADQVKRWLTDLGADRYAVREAATKGLQTLGRLVQPELQATRERATSEEIHTRLDALLARFTAGRLPTELAQARAVAALEAAGTPAAQKLLAEWAAGAPGARLTVDAKAALIRLGETK